MQLHSAPGCVYPAGSVSHSLRDQRRTSGGGSGDWRHTLPFCTPDELPSQRTVWRVPRGTLVTRTFQGDRLGRLVRRPYFLRENSDGLLRSRAGVCMCQTVRGGFGHRAESQPKPVEGGMVGTRAARRREICRVKRWQCIATPFKCEFGRGEYNALARYAVFVDRSFKCHLVSKRCHQ